MKLFYRLFLNNLNKCSPLLFYILLFSFSTSYGQTDLTSLPEPTERPGMQKQVSVNYLPSFVTAPDSQFSIYLDSQTKYLVYTSVYIVNKTLKNIILDSQDGDLHVMLEAKNKNGEWKRAQLYQPSSCGNSYYSFELKSNHFLIMKGMYPTEGYKTKLRYKLYNKKYPYSVVSNAIDGQVTDSMIYYPSFDPYAIADSSIDFLSKIVLDKISLPEPIGNLFPRTIFCNAVMTLIHMQNESAFDVLKKAAMDTTLPIDSRTYLIRNLYELKLPGVTDFLKQLLNDTTNSFQIFESSVGSLMAASKEEALGMVKTILTSGNDLRQKITWKMAMNELYKEREYLVEIANQKEFWEKDSTQYKKHNRVSWPQLPRNSGFRNTSIVWLNDSSLFQLFSNKKTSYTDPNIIPIVKGYSTYPTAEVKSNLKELIKNYSIPDSIRDCIHPGYIRFYPNKTFNLSIKALKEFNKFTPLLSTFTIKNTSDHPIQFKPAWVRDSLNIKFSIREEGKQGKSIPIEKYKVWLEDEDPEVVLKKGEEYSFVVSFDLQKYFEDKPAGKYSFSINSYLFLESICDEMASASMYERLNINNN